MSLQIQMSISQRYRWCHVTLLACFFVLFGMAGQAFAAYGNVNTTSQFDPNVMKIDEKKYLSTKISPDFAFVDETGNGVTLRDYRGKPLLIALSYYTCDGACSVINRNLWETLKDVDDWKIGQDYNVLTISFDKNDTPQTLAAFMKKSGFAGELPDGWKMTTMRSKEAISRFTGLLGFKYFWSPRDAIFLHPDAYILLTPEGRVSRYLYSGRISAEDVEFAITKSMGEEIAPANVINFLIGACYSYNYKDGKYTVDIPLIIALGALFIGVGSAAIGYFVMKKKLRRVRNETQISNA